LKDEHAFVVEVTPQPFRYFMQLSLHHRILNLKTRLR